MVLFCAVLISACTTANASSFNALQSFDFKVGAEGWSGDGANISISGGTLSGTAINNDPQIQRGPPASGFDFLGNASSGVLVRYRGSQNGATELFWGRTGADSFSAERVVQVNYSGDGEWRTLFFSLHGHPQWDDQTISRIRFDPAGGTGSTFEVDWIRVLNWDYNNDGVPDHMKGGADGNDNGLLDLEDFDANGDGIPDGWRRFVDNAPGSVRFDFDEVGNTEGWLAANDLTVLSVQDGQLTLRIDGSQPQLVRRRVHLQAALIDAFIVRIQSPSSGLLALYWAHDGAGAGSFSATRVASLSAAANPDAPKSFYLDLRDSNEWQGKLITALRLDLRYPVGTVVSIEHIHTSDGDYTRDGIPDSVKGFDDIDGDGLANFEDFDSNSDGISDAESMRRGWDPFDPIGARRDSSGNGFSDAAEAIAGADPQSARDYLSLAIDPTSAGFDLSIQANQGRTYTLNQSSDLTTWNSVSVLPQLESSSLLTWQSPVPAAGDRSFYRVKIDRPLEMYDPLDGASSPVVIGSAESTFIDSGVLRMGAPTSKGGAINFLAPSGGQNLVNFFDPGRLIQQSYYAGTPIDRLDEGQRPEWSPWVWNPIQGGDAGNQVSQVIEMTQYDSGLGFYSRTVPLLWDMTTGEKAEAYIDQWNQFELGMPDVIRITNRFISFRDPDDRWSVANRHQEFPAVYLIRSLSKIVTYTGDSPWTSDTLFVEPSITPGPPWHKYFPTEDWVAMVDPNTNVGVGVYSPMGNLFWWVGAVRTTKTGGPTQPQTMHMAPIRALRLERDSILTYRYWLIYGHIDTIRERVYELRETHPNG